MPREYRFKVGERIAGKYLVEEQLGIGTKAEVYKVCHGEHTFALKIPVVQNKDLETEKQIQELLNGVPGAIKAHDSGYLGDKKFYLVTEFVDTEICTSFRDLMIRPITGKDIIPRLRAALMFYEGTHQRGIEYYDAKPEHFLWDESQKKLYVIDYNLSIIREPPNFETFSDRYRWIVADLRRLAKTVQYTILGRDALGVDDFPEAAQPLKFPGKYDPYALFLPARLSDRPSGDDFRRIELFLHRLHGGAFSNARLAIDEFNQLLNRSEPGLDESVIEDKLRRDRSKAQEIVQGWNRGLIPSWDEVEEYWGRLAEPQLELGDFRNEAAAYVYLWAIVLAYTNIDVQAGQILKNLLQSDQSSDDKLDLRPELEFIRPAIVWLRALRPTPEEKQERLWQQVLDELKNGYRSTLSLLEKYRHQFPNAPDWRELERYVSNRQTALRKFSDPQRIDYSRLDILWNRIRDQRDLYPYPEDVHLINIAEKEAIHKKVRQEILSALRIKVKEPPKYLLEKLRENDQAIWNEMQILISEIGVHEFQATREKINEITDNLVTQYGRVETADLNNFSFDTWQNELNETLEQLSRELGLSDKISKTVDDEVAPSIDRKAQQQFQDQIKQTVTLKLELSQAEQERRDLINQLKHKADELSKIQRNLIATEKMLQERDSSLVASRAIIDSLLTERNKLQRWLINLIDRKTQALELEIVNLCDLLEKDWSAREHLGKTSRDLSKIMSEVISALKSPDKVNLYEEY